MIYTCNIKSLGITFEIVKDVFKAGQSQFKVQNVTGSTKKIKYVNFMMPPFAAGNGFYSKGNSCDRVCTLSSKLNDENAFNTCCIIEKA